MCSNIRSYICTYKQEYIVRLFVKDFYSFFYFFIFSFSKIPRMFSNEWKKLMLISVQFHLAQTLQIAFEFLFGRKGHNGGEKTVI